MYVFLWFRYECLLIFACIITWYSNSFVSELYIYTWLLILNLGMESNCILYFYVQFLIPQNLYFQDGLMSVTEVPVGIQWFIINIFSSSLNGGVISCKFWSGGQVLAEGYKVQCCTVLLNLTFESGFTTRCVVYLWSHAHICSWVSCLMCSITGRSEFFKHFNLRDKNIELECCQYQYLEDLPEGNK